MTFNKYRFKKVTNAVGYASKSVLSTFFNGMSAKPPKKTTHTRNTTYKHVKTKLNYHKLPKPHLPNIQGSIRDRLNREAIAAGKPPRW